MDNSVKRTTKYAQVVQSLTATIKQLEVTEDACLPSERELCEQFGTSRVTIRRALAELEEAGLIYRVQGKGAFVRRGKFAGKLNIPTSLTEDMQNMNIPCTSRILALDTIPAAPRVARMLQIEDNIPVVMLKRLRIAGGKPLAIETCYLHPALGPTVSKHIRDDMSLYAIFREKCGVSPTYAEQHMEVRPLQPWEQTLLGDGTPVYAMFATRQTLDENRVPLEYVESKYRADRYSYHVSMTAAYSHVRGKA